MSSFDGTPEASRANKLALNAQLHRYDPHLERLADLYDSDVAEWQKLSVLQQDRSGQYRDSRAAYRRAVEAGAVQDDRGPSTERTTSW